MMPAAATEVQAMVNLRAHCGSVTYELDEQSTSMRLAMSRGGRDKLACIVEGR